MIDWPQPEKEPINEYDTPYLFTAIFPTLFPNGGKGDPMAQKGIKNVELKKRIQHLLWYAEPEPKPDGTYYYRFASHHSFGFWCYDMLERHAALDQCGYVMNQNSIEKHMTCEEMQTSLTNNQTPTLLKKLQTYSRNVTGSPSFWHWKGEQTKQAFMQLNSPTIFWTYSFAAYHLPNLHTFSPVFLFFR